MRVYRWLTWLVLLAGLAVACVVLGLRYVVLPNLDTQRERIEALVGEAAGQRVTLGRIEGRWTHYHPLVLIDDVVVHDARGDPGLALAHVRVELGWRSLIVGKLRLHSLVIEAPRLEVRRDADGRVTVAGFAIDGPSDDTAFADWVLAQGRIRVTGGTIVWHDVQRGAPLLELHDVELRLDNAGRRHRFGLTARPTADVGAAFDVRGDLRRTSRHGLDIARLRLHAALPYVNLGAVRSWVDLPVDMRSGAGAIEAWAERAGARWLDATADLHLAGGEFRVPEVAPLLEVAGLQGRVVWKPLASGMRIDLQRFTASVPGAGYLSPSDTRIELRQDATDRVTGIKFDAARIDVGPVAALVARAPIPPEARDWLVGLRPRARLDNVAVDWNARPAGTPPQFSVQARFADLAIDAHRGIPGVSHLHGTVAATGSGGRVQVDGRDVALDVPGVFEAPLEFAALSAAARWEQPPAGRGLAVTIDRATFSNRDLDGSAAGSWRASAGPGPGVIDLQARLTRTDARSVVRYVPVYAKQARAWMGAAILGGAITDARVVLQGDLRRFPFEAPGSGRFEVDSTLAGVRLAVAPEWPPFENVEGRLAFRGKRMEIDVQGRALAARIRRAQVVIPDLEASDPMLEVRGDAQGPTADFLQYLEASPVGRMIGHATRELRATGSGKLDLEVAMPLDHTLDTRVRGSYGFTANHVESIDGAVPTLHALTGVLRFDEKGVQARKVTAEVFGMPVNFDVATEPGGAFVIDARGRTALDDSKRRWPSPLWAYLSGDTDWHATLRAVGALVDLRVDSALAGIAVALPAPLGKRADEPLPLAARVQVRAGATEFDGRLGGRASFVGVIDETGGGRRLERLALDFGPAARLPTTPLLRVTGQLPAFDLDEWLDVRERWSIDRAPAQGTTNATTATTTGAEAVPGGAVGLDASVDLRIGKLELFGRDFHEVAAVFEQRGARWRGRIDSREVKGNVDWSGQGKGRLVAQLERLHLPDLDPTETTVASAEPIRGEQLPALDVMADSVRIGRFDLGKGVLRAIPDRIGWTLQALELAAPEGVLSASGRWTRDGKAPQRSDFEWTIVANDVGKLGERVGRTPTIVGASGRATGTLHWYGPPLAPDLPSLGGAVALNMRKGRFLEVDPGIGKLVGLISLQSIPRRITFDFRDIFAKGFAFDSIDAKGAIAGGVLKLQDFRMVGPAARVNMDGSLDLARETADLDVIVLPQISDSVAIGAAVVNPIAGLATFIVGKVLKDPIARIAAFEYRIRGPWSEPDVTAVSRVTPNDNSQLKRR